MTHFGCLKDCHLVIPRKSCVFPVDRECDRVVYSEDDSGFREDEERTRHSHPYCSPPPFIIISCLPFEEGDLHWRENAEGGVKRKDTSPCLSLAAFRMLKSNLGFTAHGITVLGRGEFSVSLLKMEVFNSGLLFGKDLTHLDA
ncbi:hypothetical protein CEXT_347001 [Caerostris extrusa]|uniref:Uncharacterized protein n=1 Tax=Caerostris extrusa TaxID=172846 RepID=A0AAV4VFQ4_CAEEX|nr:hypothetical protein CEXT_347001 [Caerostris extrusa]